MSNFYYEKLPKKLKNKFGGFFWIYRAEARKIDLFQSFPVLAILAQVVQSLIKLILD